MATPSAGVHVYEASDRISRHRRNNLRILAVVTITLGVGLLLAMLWWGYGSFGPE